MTEYNCYNRASCCKWRMSRWKSPTCELAIGCHSKCVRGTKASRLKQQGNALNLISFIRLQVKIYRNLKDLRVFINISSQMNLNQFYMNFTELSFNNFFYVTDGCYATGVGTNEGHSSRYESNPGPP